MLKKQIICYIKVMGTIRLIRDSGIFCSPHNFHFFLEWRLENKIKVCQVVILFEFSIIFYVQNNLRGIILRLAAGNCFIQSHFIFTFNFLMHLYKSLTTDVGFIISLFSKNPTNNTGRHIIQKRA